ncbi:MULTISPECIES: TadE/TadG family type IV pilus assembly protein [unclassified Bradyrhizobium]|uniref:TadE/TadG family type IV pilus assembly protein n=1 Tax=unclassified Bradyrhizobium TaxID=2631580 RepID=UPI0024790FCA|nr:MULTISPECIES: TadE/TadG family type IV pilus assembly protein [unclassified Bradyrhizobium]WGR72484.1 pilus assembly protein [Bradyrhizobium sp. ISRA426]WGR77317.1 pilus assembly protein [Bradyrhizobium sp. ISRA430]WGR87723.1 pilus assembly protein [Bradyrhizobium sp. ISRA432]
MKLTALWQDIRGASALEFALTAPVFFLFIFGIIEFGLLFWTQLGLQHGTEMAARCATVNSTLCPSGSAITNYAAQQAFGLTLPAETFTYSSSTCGNQVSASYSFQFPQILNLSPVMLTARACFPS